MQKSEYVYSVVFPVYSVDVSLSLLIERYSDRSPVNEKRSPGSSIQSHALYYLFIIS